MFRPQPPEFTHLGGLGDTQQPMLISSPTSNWLLGLGPTRLLPTATREEFGQVAQVKLNIILVIPSLVKNPILGK